MTRSIFRKSMTLLVLLLAAPAVLASSLSYNPAENVNLASGHYGFSAYHGPWEGSFHDTWSFSLAEDSKVSLVIKDIEFGLLGIKLLGISNMEILFDGQTSLDEGGWYHQMLAAGNQYQFAVSGNIAGLLGGAYHGKLSVSAVPLPAAAWLFLSALAGLLVIRRRQQPQPAAA